MNILTIIQSPAVVAAIGAIVAGYFVQRRLVVMSNLARSITVAGLKQGNVRTKFNAFTGGFESETTDFETAALESSESKKPPDKTPPSRGERIIKKEGGEKEARA